MTAPAGERSAGPDGPAPAPPRPPSETPADFRRALDGAPLLTRFEWHEEIGSTQTRALELAAEGAPPGTLVVARTQTEGRGRRDHGWASPPGGLWFSLLAAAPPSPPPGALAIPIVAALAARAAVAGAAGFAPRIKWPNDLFAGRRKFGGVIAAEREGRIAIGVGIDVNVRRLDLPAALAEIATSTLEETGREIALAPLLRRFLFELAPRLERRASGGGDLRDEALACLIREHPVRVLEAGGRPARVGRIVEIEPSGALVLEGEGGRAVVTSGDLEILWPGTT